MSATMNMAEPATRKAVTQAQIHLWFADLTAMSGGNSQEVLRDELMAYIWAHLMLQLEQHRKKGLLAYEGATRRLVEYQELQDIFWEFTHFRKNANEKYTFDQLLEWLWKSINALLEERNVRVIL